MGKEGRRRGRRMDVGKGEGKKELKRKREGKGESTTMVAS